MAQLICETSRPPAVLNFSGDVHMREQMVPPYGAVPPEMPVRIIANDQEAYVHFHLRCTGSDVYTLWGHWHFTILFERMGAGEGPASLMWSGNNGTGGINGLLQPGEDVVITIPAGYFSPVLLQGQNVFRVVATVVRHRDPISGAPLSLEIAAFTDLGLIQVYHDE